MPLPLCHTWEQWLAATPADRAEYTTNYGQRLALYIQTGAGAAFFHLEPAGEVQKDHDEDREGTYR